MDHASQNGQSSAACECRASHFWLCIAGWIIVGLVAHGRYLNVFRDLSGWQTILAAPFVLAVAIFAALFGVIGNVLPARYLGDRMQRSRWAAIRDRAHLAPVIWIVAISVYGWAVFPSS